MVRLLRVPGECWDRKDASNRVVCVRDARIGKNVIQCATYGSAKLHVRTHSRDPQEPYM